MSDKNSIVVVYGTSVEAESAARDLYKSGFDVKKVSILGEDYRPEQQVPGVAVGGVNTLGAELSAFGIPGDSILRYVTAVQSNKWVLFIHGTTDEVTKARYVLKTTGPEESNIHFVDEGVLASV